MKQEKRLTTKEEIGELKPSELNLIYHLRNRFRFGEIRIQVRDGFPWRISRITEYEDC